MILFGIFELVASSIKYTVNTITSPIKEDTNEVYELTNDDLLHVKNNEAIRLSELVRHNSADIENSYV